MEPWIFAHHLSDVWEKRGGLSFTGGAPTAIVESGAPYRLRLGRAVGGFRGGGGGISLSLALFTDATPTAIAALNEAMTRSGAAVTSIRFDGAAIVFMIPATDPSVPPPTEADGAAYTVEAKRLPHLRDELVSFIPPTVTQVCVCPLP